MQYTLGEDRKRHPIRWNTTDDPLLTVTGDTAVGKSMLLAHIMREAQQAGVAVTHLGLTTDLTGSPTVETLAYDHPDEIIEQFNRILAEQERRKAVAQSYGTTAQQSDSLTTPQLLLVCDDFPTINPNPFGEHEQPSGDTARIIRLLTRIIQNAVPTNTAIVISGQRLNRRNIGTSLTHILQAATHLHLGRGVMTGLIGHANHETATRLIRDAGTEHASRYGWGVIEHPRAAVRTIQCPDMKKAA